MAEKIVLKSQYFKWQEKNIVILAQKNLVPSFNIC